MTLVTATFEGGIGPWRMKLHGVLGTWRGVWKWVRFGWDFHHIYMGPAFFSAQAWRTRP